MFVDTHCHLIDGKYGDLMPEKIVEDTLKEGVEMICNGCGIEESKKSIELAEKYKGVWVCVGLAYDSQRINLEKTKIELEKMCQHKKVLGIGEAGLDFYEGIGDDLIKWQEELFRMLLEVAKETKLPVRIHNRMANDQVLKLIDEYEVRGVLHCFSGNAEFMKEATERDLYVSIGGLVTFKSRGDLREVVKVIPEDRLLLETDAPYLAPEPVRGTVNIPRNVKIVAGAVARIRNTSIEEIEEITEINTRNLFKYEY